MTINWEAVEQWCCLFFNFTQFVILEKFINLGLGTVRSERGEGVNVLSQLLIIASLLRGSRHINSFIDLVIHFMYSTPCHSIRGRLTSNIHKLNDAYNEMWMSMNK